MLKKSELLIPYAPVERILKETTNMRVSQDATKALTEELIFIGKKVSEKAWKFAQHSGRMTVTDKDIKLAYEQLYK